ncbi:hypothetical protein CPC08DRAFT_708862 [Agrocybe pediades]|nr:hypothetical protein CPC08DRAFT_708862 [Agrocybe pediades]
MFSFKAISALIAASLLASSVGASVAPVRRQSGCVSACPPTVQTFDLTTTPPTIVDLWAFDATSSSAGPPLTCAYTRLIPISILPPVVTGNCVYDSTTGLLLSSNTITDCPAAVPLSVCM